MLLSESRLSKHNFLIIGSKDSLRVHAFQKSLQSCIQKKATIVTYKQVLEQPESIKPFVNSETIIRFESPEQDLSELKALYIAGIDQSSSSGLKTLIGNEINAYLEDHGRIVPPAQLSYGLIKAASFVENYAEETHAYCLSSSSDMLAAMDKTSCLKLLQNNHIHSPYHLGSVTSFDELVELAKQTGKFRLFVKLRFGFSAAGMMALAINPSDSQVIAYTTAMMAPNQHLYATRKLQKLNRVNHIDQLIEKLAPMGLHIESWVPKAGVNDSTVDFRFISIQQEPIFSILRLSKSPITNLHLGNSRADPSLLKQHMQPKDWLRLEETCTKVAKLFPSSFMLGIDVAVFNDLRQHAVLEVNPFGDFIKDVTYQNLSPYDHQITKWPSNEIKGVE